MTHKPVRRRWWRQWFPAPGGHGPTPRRGMPLTWLSVAYTRASDLSPLRGMPLQELLLIDAPVSDLSPLRGMPPTTLRLTFRPERDGEIVRSLTMLKIINDKPAAEFRKAVTASRARRSASRRSCSKGSG